MASRLLICRAARRDGELLDATFGYLGNMGRWLHEYQAAQERGRGELLVAWVGTSLAGMAFLRFPPVGNQTVELRLPGVPEIESLNVREDLRRRGVGTGLVRAAEQAAATAGYRSCWLAVEPGNLGAYRLYKQLGYRDWCCGQVEFTYGCGGWLLPVVKRADVLVQQLAVGEAGQV